ncbi:MAG TPA: DUF4157 domain-containing protein [Thermoanaerobaculia bacterium]|nr:DUF4157 domain-containing protein [Thermoanaerobaculia bacterium]
MAADCNGRDRPGGAIESALAEARALVRMQPWWLRPLLVRGVEAITLGRRIYLARGVTGTHLERLLRHELAHVRQIRRLGLFRFYWRYLAEYLRNRWAGMPPAEAYRRISFEIEAVSAEDV